jgi:type I site-specific restriction endonuclease
MKAFPLETFNFNGKMFDGVQTNTFFDPIRKKHIQLNKEEFIRQYILKQLIEVITFPKARIQVEKGLNINQMQKRTDILLYNKDFKPVILIECKAYDVEITQEVLDQAISYNRKLDVEYILLSNGRQHYMLQIKPKIVHLNYFPCL